MNLLSKISEYSSRHVISVAVAVIVALLVNRVWASEQQGWIVITALLTSQTTRGTPLKQGLYIACLIFIAVMSATLLVNWVPADFILKSIAIIIFIMAGLAVYYYRPLQDATYLSIILFPLIFMLTSMMPGINITSISTYAMEVIIGVCIGIACGQIILPVRPYNDFVRGLTPVLTSLTDDSLSLHAPAAMYPEWVYETGFNPGLRSGFRFFLVTLERICELHFSLDYLIELGVKKHFSDEMLRLVADVVNENNHLIETLNKKLNGDSHTPDSQNFTDDITALEEQAKQTYPTGLELLRDLKDIRMLLLQLMLAVPESAVKS